MQFTQIKDSVPQDCPLLQTPITSSGSQITHSFYPTLLRIRGSRAPLLGFDNLLKWFIEFKGTVYLLIPIYNKGCVKGHIYADRWRDAPGDIWKGPEHRSFNPCGVPPSWHMNAFLFTNPEALQIPLVRVFMEVSLYRCGWLSHWPLVKIQPSVPLPSVDVGGGTESSISLIEWWLSLAVMLGDFQNHLINVTQVWSKGAFYE